ncbi:MAG TPA: methyltransferase domain-containing protein [Pyrinomonadaceae bacterium]|nr:methyltransferase domain-containing protein [Pyrinomonadaceae bacterium]
MRPTAGTFRQRFYPATYPAAIDGTPILQQWIRDRLSPGSLLLDLGAGRGHESHDYRDLAVVTGVDINPVVLSNPYVHRSAVASGARLPFPSSSFDVCFSDFVFEHVERPRKIVTEIHRILKPGGWLIFRTPNVWHYVPIASILMPDTLRSSVLQRIGRKEEDSYPTLYRFNSKRRIVHILKECGFEIEDMKCIEGPPDYLATFPRLYYLGVLYERVANYSERFSFMRGNILVVARKGKENTDQPAK